MYWYVLGRKKSFVPLVHQHFDSEPIVILGIVQ